LAPQETTKYQV